MELSKEKYLEIIQSENVIHKISGREELLRAKKEEIKRLEAENRGIFMATPKEERLQQVGRDFFNDLKKSHNL